MFKDESMQFIIYILSIGVLIILTFCMLQIFVLEQDIPLLDDLGIRRDENLDDFEYSDSPAQIIKADKDYQATFQTNLGIFTVELFEENAPNTVNNFVFLASEGYYDGVKVHRVIKDLLFQTGDRNTLTNNEAEYGLGGPGYDFADEINWESLDLGATKIQELSELEYVSSPNLISKPLQKYSLAMANSKPNSNGSQFFIATANNGDLKLEALHGKHTVFGKVMTGFDTVDKINNAEVDVSNKEVPLPYKDIIIVRIDIIELEKSI